MMFSGVDKGTQNCAPATAIAPSDNKHHHQTPSTSQSASSSLISLIPHKSLLSSTGLSAETQCSSAHMVQLKS